MSAPTRRNDSDRTAAARLLGFVTATAAAYLLPFAVSVLAACVWLVVISVVTEATGSSLLVMALAILPGAAAMVISGRERRHWHEYALVWLGFFTAVPLYGVGLLIGGYGLVAARAWRRRWPHPSQGEPD